MTLLEKITYLLSKNGLNKRQFSIQAQIPYSTIDNWYKVGYDKMQLPQFIRLCEFFGVTMDSMAYDDREIEFKKDVVPQEFTAEEKSIIHNFRYLDDDGRKRVLYTIEMEKSIEIDRKKEGCSA